MKKKRVVVAMSGGVDSSVAAALLVRQGYEVIGITMCFNLPDAKGKRPSCCGLTGIEDARRVANILDIKHYVVSMQKVLEERVIKDFCDEYLKGRTPNPCIRCNQYVKFDALLKKARILDARYLATGHYARIVKTRTGFFLKKARDMRKDQSYFLYRLGQGELRHVLFPLGEYTKAEVRGYARDFGLPVADKLDSQEICFLPNMDYRTFIATRLNKNLKPGPIVDTQGALLGQHKGIAFYTIGQREGLGIARGYPAYITKIDALGNRIVIGKREDALAREFLLTGCHFVLEPIKKKVALRVRIRYNHREAYAEIEPNAQKIKVTFETPQFAVTPGQSAVFYRTDTVIGGGFIDAVL